MIRVRHAIVFAVLVVGVPMLSYGDALTYAKDVAPILFDNCVRCHRSGEVAPMSLLTYDEVRPFAKAMKEKVVKGDMPPWKVDPKYGVFANDMRLTKGQIETIAAWVDDGAPRGNPADMPPAPVFGEGWQLGEPDYVVELPEQIVPAAMEDLFPNRFAMVDLPEARWVRAIEFMPGDKRVVHHVLSFLGDLRMSSGSDDVEEAQQRGGGQAEIFLVYVAGSQATVYPEGMGRKLTKKQPMTFNMHYHACGEDTKDVTKLGLYFGEGDLKKSISTTFAVNLGLKIPPGEANYEKTAMYLFDADSRIVSFLPHMHMRGKSMMYRAIYPDGREETLLNVPQYDYNWQWIYYPKEPVSVPAGTRVVVTAAYDNSEANTANPDPKRTVYYRDPTFEEMFVGFM
ncbi:MAG: thiol-disulfide isomerase, partial [Candidatus Hydrogenedentota bacterium]